MVFLFPLLLKKRVAIGNLENILATFYLLLEKIGGNRHPLATPYGNRLCPLRGKITIITKCWWQPETPGNLELIIIKIWWQLATNGNKKTILQYL